MSLRKHELIGLTMTITSSPDPSLIGIAGKVVDESRNLLVVSTSKGEKRVPKHGNTFRFDVRDGVEIKGDDLLFRPEDRTKRAR